MFFVHIFGAFCVGEIVGRRNIVGYNVKDVMWDVHNDEHEKHHHEQLEKKRAEKKKLEAARAAATSQE